MRFLIGISVVAALALVGAMAHAVCTTPNPQTLLNVDDADLLEGAESSGEYVVDTGVACQSISWTWEFTRSSKQGGRTKVWASIEGTNPLVIESIDSQIITERGRHQKNDSGTVQSSPNEIIFELDGTHRSTGHFSDMDFYANYPK